MSTAKEMVALCIKIVAADQVSHIVGHLQST